MPEDALDRLFRETTERSENKRSNYNFEDQIDELTSQPEEDDLFIDNMSQSSKDALINKIKPQVFEEEVESDSIPDPEETSTPSKPAAEEVVSEEPKKEYKKRGPKPKNKDVQQTTPAPARSTVKNTETSDVVSMFMNNLALECLDHAAQSGLTIHGFSEDQMTVIWSYIRDHLA